MICLIERRRSRIFFAGSEAVMVVVSKQKPRCSSLRVGDKTDFLVFTTQPSCCSCCTSMLVC